MKPWHRDPARAAARERVAMLCVAVSVMLAAGCSSTGTTTVKTPLARPAGDFKVLVVDVASLVANSEQTTLHLEGALVEQLRELQIFERVYSRRALGSRPYDAMLTATISSFRGVSGNMRAWAGAAAGASHLVVDVIMTDAKSGTVVTSATVQGDGSGGPIGGTSVEAVQRVTEQITKLIAGR